MGTETTSSILSWLSHLTQQSYEIIELAPFSPVCSAYKSGSSESCSYHTLKSLPEMKVTKSQEVFQRLNRHRKGNDDDHFQ